jgi:hypothetical protein
MLRCLELFGVQKAIETGRENVLEEDLPKIGRIGTRAKTS